MRHRCLTSFALVTLVAAAAHADPITFTTRSAFESALGARITDDYSAPGYAHGDVAGNDDVDVHTDAHMSAVLGQTRYVTTGHKDNNVIIGQNSIFEGQAFNPTYCAGCNGSFRLSFGATSVGDDRGVFGVGFDFFDFRRPPYDAFIVFGDDSSMSFDLPNSAIRGFFGITAPQRIRSIHFAPNGGRSASIDGSFGIDNLTIGAATPEPATLVLVALGLSGAAARRVVRRRGSRA